MAADSRGLAINLARMDWNDFASSESGRSNASPTKQVPRYQLSPAPLTNSTSGGPSRNQRGGTSNQTESEKCFMATQMPANWTAKTCFDVFSKYGNITNIHIFQKPDGSSFGRAKITFAPPPKNNNSRDSSLEETCPIGGGLVKLGWRPYFNDDRSNRPSTERIQVRAKRIGVGVMERDGNMLELFRSHEYPEDTEQKVAAHRFFPITIVATPEYHEFSINFPVHHRVKDGQSRLNRTDVLRVTFTLRQRLQVLLSTHPVDPSVIILAFNSEIVPKCSRKGEEDRFFRDHPYSWNERDSYYRQTDVLLDPHSDISRKRPASLRRDDSVVNLGRWNAWSLCIKTDSRNAKERPALDKLLNTFREYNVDVQEVPSFKVLSGVDVPVVWSFIDPPPEQGQGSLSELLGGELPVGFDVRYQLEVCLSGGWLNEYELTREWVAKLRTLQPMQACALLEYVATDRPDQKTRRIRDPFSIFKWYAPKQSVLAQKCPAGKVVIRSATITPTTVIFNTPSIEISNRVIRQFSKAADRFLRIRFLDERTMGRIYGRSGSSIDNEVYTRIKRILTNGVEVGDRHYDLLAWGNSQFRENGAYFFSNTSDLTAEMIREWMGDFSDIKVVAKYAARIGQCFSTTRAVSNVKPNLLEIPDVERNGCNFTDGVGKISSLLAGLARKDFKMASNPDEVPSAYQFRLGGYKGVLAVWPDMKGLELCLRPSQNKFKALKVELEIIRHSQATGFSLNRQLIVVMSALGIPDDIFLNKAAHQLELIHRSMKEPDVARQALRSSVDANHMTPMIADMVVAGFQARKEPFLMALLYLWRAWSIKYLKEKARIHISQGVVVIGITDEIEVLRGHFSKDQPLLKSKNERERLKAVPEVFLQLSDFEGTGQSKVMTGLMILARNPSLHAGDIRVVQGVDNQKLRHLRDVVVLPQTGDRDIAGMCSGGDLDGDDYLVCWDPELIPPEWNVEPMDFTPPAAIKKDRVTLDDLTSFFVRYMKNTELGQIAHHHLAYADSSELGVKSEKCIRLAQLHSNAVDYPKTGVAAIIPNELRVKKWPHFMEKKNSYTSTSALGKLYDSVEREAFEPPYDNPFDDRVLHAYPTSVEQELAASEIKAHYDAALRRLMQQHGIKTEFEVWSTFVMDYNRNISDYKFAEELGQDVSAIKEQYVDICVDKAGGRDPQLLEPFVVAMYKVTQEQVSNALYECENIRVDQDGNVMEMRDKSPASMPFMSFPWLFSPMVCKIARVQEQKRGNSSSGLAVLNLDGPSTMTKKGVERTTVDCLPNTELASPANDHISAEGMYSRDQLGMAVGRGHASVASSAKGNDLQIQDQETRLELSPSISMSMSAATARPKSRSPEIQQIESLVDLIDCQVASSKPEVGVKAPLSNVDANWAASSVRSDRLDQNDDDDDDDDNYDTDMINEPSAMDQLDSMFA